MLLEAMASGVPVIAFNGVGAFNKQIQHNKTGVVLQNKCSEELAKAIKELPNSREIPELVRRISSIGKKIGLQFLLFKPMPEVVRDFYAEVPVKLKVEGSFHEVATFFDRIGKLNRIVNVKNITISDPEERSGKVMLTIEGTAVTYRFLTEEEKSGTSGRRRRR